MVHIVRKKVGNYEYLYLQRSLHIKGTGKKKTEHVAYLGRADQLPKLSEEIIKRIAFAADNNTKKEFKKLLKRYKN